MANTKVTLKLLIDSKNNRVLFAEAGKDFVDFLFALLALPLGTVTGLLETNSQCMVGCFGNLYESVENLSQTYIQEGKNKDLMLNPAFNTSGTPLLLPHTESSSTAVYLCKDYHNPHKYAANNPNVNCPECRDTKMSRQVTYISTSANNTHITVEEGYVKGVVTYMVMDNLDVSPMSTISSISMLNKFNIQDLGSLEEKVVDFSMAEGLELLKASLSTKAVLTSVFLGKKAE